ncbi:MAG: hypothetical protein HOO06_16460 [Bdellovibrionaceae bacterium]|nr:hypothetical protein [Pseudobdellovibrionaceae bacterium]
MNQLKKVYKALFLILALTMITACDDDNPARSSSNGTDPTRYSYACPQDPSTAEYEKCVEDYLSSTNSSYQKHWNGVLTIKDKPLYRTYLKTLIQQQCDTNLSWQWPIDYDDCDVWDERMGMMLWSNGLTESSNVQTSLWKLLDKSIVDDYGLHVEREFWRTDEAYKAILDNTILGITNDKLSVYIEQTNFVEDDMDVTVNYQGEVLAEGTIFFQ